MFFAGQITGVEGYLESAGSGLVAACLLYTSDAADDLLCVDLGGRRIIKKKKKIRTKEAMETDENSRETLMSCGQQE